MNLGYSSPPTPRNSYLSQSTGSFQNLDCILNVLFSQIMISCIRLHFHSTAKTSFTFSEDFSYFLQVSLWSPYLRLVIVGGVKWRIYEGKLPEQASPLVLEKHADGP